ncbi:MAG: isocitrate dehydrogenase [Candidatus Sericytochromatia bacterium]|nr:isocitrate dehydrogenase [Candidatus Sericytochromatia bacterium]
MTTHHTATVTATTTGAWIPGDGNGPEIAAAVRDVLAAAGAPIAWDEQSAGLGCIDWAPNGLPDATLSAIRRHKVALKGPTATPVGGGHKSVNVTIRKALELYANVRPVKSLPGVTTRFANVDLVIVRENVEDTYGGIEHMQTPDVAQCLKVITRQGSLAIARYAFELARAWGRRRVTCVHKANIHKLTDGLFLTCFQEVAADYPDIASDSALVDAVCMQLVTAPERFDVLVMPNLYGDILSDLAAGLVGGLGVAPAGNIGEDIAVFEAVHGTAPDIAGMGLANPTALLLSATQMLRHLGQHGDAGRIEAALTATLAAGIVIRGLGGSASTSAFVQAIISHLPDAIDAAASGPQARIPAAPAAPVTPSTAWVLDGVDVFVECEGVPQLPEAIGPFVLRLISNRGTKIYPGPVPDIRLVNWHRVRYIAQGPVTDDDVLALVAEVGRHYRWMHLEKLCQADGTACYSKAQGE